MRATSPGKVLSVKCGLIIIQKSRDAASGSIPADRSEYNQIITIAGHAVTV